MKRRDVLAGAGGLAFAGMAGCLGAVGLDEFEASPAGVEEGVRSETGYEQVGVEEAVIERRFQRGPVDEEIRVTNYQTQHEKSVDLGPLGSQRAAVFVVLTSPQISIAGQQLNPISDMSTNELVDLVAENYDGMGNVREDVSEDVTVLEQETTKTRFEADAEFDGRDVEVYLHATESVETSDDHLVNIGVYPKEIHDQEGPNVVELMQNVVEDIDADTASSSEGTESGSEDDSTSDSGDGGSADTATDDDNGSVVDY